MTAVAESRAARRTMRKTIGFTIGTRALQIVCSFAGTVVTARFLGPTDRGAYFLVVTTALVVVQFASLGLQASNTFKVAQDDELFGPLVTNTIWASLVLGVGGAAATVLILGKTSSLVPHGQPALLWFAVGFTPAMLVFLLGTNLLVGTQRMRAFNIVETVGNILVVAALVIAGVAGARVGWFLASSCCAWLAIGAVLVAYLVRVSGATWRPRRDVFASGFRYAAKAYAISVLGFLVLRGNVFVLQHFYGSRELGYYSVAAQVGDALAILPASVSLVLFPRLVRQSADRWKSTLRATVTVAVLLAIVCAAAAVLATPFMRIAFGSSFTPAAQVLRLMLPGVFAVGTTTILSQYLGAIGMPRAMVGIWAVALVVVLAMGRLLVPAHAGAGAAAALSTTYLLLLGMIFATGLHYRHIGRPVGAPLEPAEAPPG
jgi:antigen flippase